jgi:hypothetical protein
MNLPSTLLHVRPSVRPRTARAVGIRLGGGRNEAGRGRGATKNLENPQFRFGGLATPWNPTKPPKLSLEKLGENRRQFGKAWRKSLEAAFISPVPPPSGGVAAPVANSNRASRAKGPQRLHAVECERSLIAPQPGARPAEGTRNFPGCKALKSHKTAKALPAYGNGPRPPPRENGEGNGPTCRPGPGSRAKRGRA